VLDFVRRIKDSGRACVYIEQTSPMCTRWRSLVVLDRASGGRDQPARDESEISPSTSSACTSALSMTGAADRQRRRAGSPRRIARC